MGNAILYPPPSERVKLIFENDFHLTSNLRLFFSSLRELSFPNFVSSRNQLQQYSVSPHFSDLQDQETICGKGGKN
jgi:hypothetical protein